MSLSTIFFTLSFISFAISNYLLNRKVKLLEFLLKEQEKVYFKNAKIKNDLIENLFD